MMPTAPKFSFGTAIITASAALYSSAPPVFSELLSAIPSMFPLW
jgi:hypothetical protein